MGAVDIPSTPDRAMADCPTIFNAKKAGTLESLSRTADQYSDSSPKGSVDEGIRELIDRINAVDGLVTTSSCAGRISVFLEGRKHRQHSTDASGRRATAGGKGLGGRWLYVSHEPVTASPAEGAVIRLLGLSESPGPDKAPPTTRLRLVKLQFEPAVSAESLPARPRHTLSAP